jgi:hypothetical protein
MLAEKTIPAPIANDPRAPTLLESSTRPKSQKLAPDRQIGQRRRSPRHWQFLTRH